MRKVQMDTGFQISLFLLRVFSFSLYIIIFMYSLGFAKIGHNYHSLFSFFEYYFYQVFHSVRMFHCPGWSTPGLAIQDDGVRLYVVIRVSFVMCLEFAIKRVHLTFYGQN